MTATRIRLAAMPARLVRSLRCRGLPRHPVLPASNPSCYGYCHSDGDSNCNCYLYANAYSNSDGNSDGDSYGNGYAYTNGYATDGDRH